MTDMLTPDEIADYLQISGEKVTKWLERGDLAGLNLDGEWRVPLDEFVRFVSKKAGDSQLEALRKNIQDPVLWAKALEGLPVLTKNLEVSEYAEHTFGAFLKESLKAHKVRDEADNIVDFIKSTDD